MFVDIGASGGLENVWKRNQNDLTVIGFEPDEKEYKKLIKMGKSNRHYINSAVSDFHGFKELLVRQAQGNTSFYEFNQKLINVFPHMERFNIISRATVKTDTLDSLLTKNNYNNPDFLKIDVEGAELDVLNGGIKSIANDIFGIQIEVRFIEFYKNSPLFSTINNFLINNNFQLFDMNRYYYKRSKGLWKGCLKGQLGVADALYLKTSNKLLENCEGLNSIDQKKRKLLRALKICLVYGYYDYASELLSCGKDYYSDEEYKIIFKEINEYYSFSERIPNFKGKAYIHSLLIKFANIFKSSHLGAYESDQMLGNKYLY
jgi:FkbM family methyltransferase